MEDVILGADFLRTYGAIVNFVENNIRLEHPRYLFENDPKYHGPSPNYSFRLVQPITLHPNSVQKARIQTNNEALDAITDTFLLEPKRTLFEKKGVVVATCLTIVSRGFSTVWLANHTNERIIIPSGTSIATGVQIGGGATSPIVATIHESMQSIKTTNPRTQELEDRTI